MAGSLAIGRWQHLVVVRPLRRLAEAAPAGEAGATTGLLPSAPFIAGDASAGPDATAAATERKIGWVRDAAGDRFDAIELQTRIHLIVVTDDRQGTADLLAEGFGLSPAEALESPHALCGTVEEIADDLIARRERFGIGSIGIALHDLGAMAPVIQRLAGT